MRIRLEAEAVLYIQEKIATHEIELAWSYIIDYENRFNPFEEKRSAVDDLRTYATIDTGETDDILAAAEYIQKFGIKAFDALHVACAIETRCDYFLTADDSLLKKLSRFAKIKVISPIELIRILEEK
jgi:predicted nucleic acid-binding protein